MVDVGRRGKAQFIYAHRTYLYLEVSAMLVYHDKEVVKTTVSIPAYLRAYANDQGINLSGTLREVLRKDYEKKAGSKATTPTPAPTQNAHTCMGR